MSKTYKKGDSLLRKKLFWFAIRTVRLNSFLTEQKREYLISKLMMRSGTNPGAMVREGLNMRRAAGLILYINWLWHSREPVKRNIGRNSYMPLDS